MKVWEVKTNRHGVTLINARTITQAIEGFLKFNRQYLKRTQQTANEFKDSITSCICLGEVANA